MQFIDPPPTIVEATARLNENGLSGDVMDESHTPQAPSSQEYGLEPSGHVIPGAEVGRGVSDAFGRVEPQEFDNSPKGGVYMFVQNVVTRHVHVHVHVCTLYM